MAVAIGGAQHLLQFQRQPRRRGVADQRQRGEKRVLGLGVEGEVVLSDQFERPQHPHRVLLKAQHRVADGAYDAVLDVFAPLAGEVEQFGADRVEKEGVDGEVAPPGVFLGGAVIVVGENHVLRQRFPGFAALELVRRAAEGADFDDFLAQMQVRQPEAFADDPDAAAAEDVAHFLRGGGGGEIVVLGPATEQEVADGAADDVTFKTGFL